MQQICAGARRYVRSTQHSEVHKINAIYTEMFSLSFLVVIWLQYPIKALNVAHGN